MLLMLSQEDNLTARYVKNTIEEQAIYLAISGGHLDVVKLFLSKLYIDKNRVLEIAAEYGKKDILDYAIAMEPDRDAFISALSFSIANGYPELVEHLVPIICNIDANAGHSDCSSLFDDRRIWTVFHDARDKEAQPDKEGEGVDPVIKKNYARIVNYMSQYYEQQGQ